MEKWHLIIDVEKCEDCNNCMLACKDEHVDNAFEGYTLSQPKLGHHWINILRTERGTHPFIDVAYLPVPCFHCDDAPCVKAGKDGAVYKRPDGIVLIDPVKARGQEKIVNFCPYGAIWWNETENIPQKCTLCAHLLDDGWKEARCVNACPTGAMRIIKADRDQMNLLIDREELEPYQSKHHTLPRVHYKNLYRFTHRFIGGSVAATRNSATDCVKSAVVVLSDPSGQEIAETLTDAFGDFKFDQIDHAVHEITLNIRHADLGEKTVAFKLGDGSLYTGIIEL